MLAEPRGQARHPLHQSEPSDPAAGYRALRSLPCAVSAQITATEMATNSNAQIGYQGIHANATSIAIDAAWIPTTRAHVVPLNSPMPAASTTRPTSAWIQAHVVTSNWKMCSSPTT